MKIYNCATEEEAKLLFLYLMHLGLTWRNGTKLDIESTSWGSNGTKTCYFVRDSVTYSHTTYCKNMGYKYQRFSGNIEYYLAKKLIKEGNIK